MPGNLSGLAHPKPKSLPPRSSPTWPLATQERQAAEQSSSLASFRQGIQVQQEAQIRACQERIETAAANAGRASDPAGFTASWGEIRNLPVAGQMKPWAALADQLATHHADLPDPLPMTVRDEVIKGMEKLPVGKDSARQLAAPLMASVGMINSMFRDAGLREIQRAIRRAMAEGVEITPESFPASFDMVKLHAAMPDLVRLNQLVKNHRMHAQPDLMYQLMGKMFSGTNTPDAVRVAVLLFPRRLAELELGEVDETQVRQMMLDMMRHAASPRGMPLFRKVDEPGAKAWEKDWGTYVGDEVKKALAKHNIHVGGDSELGEAIQSLKQFD